MSVLLALAPMVMNHATVGLSGEAEIVAGLERRIDRHRKVDLEVLVTDEAGRAVPRASVHVRQVRHEFLFGCNIFAWGTFDDPAAERAYRRRFAELFNYATLPFYWWGYERAQGRPQHERMAELARWCRQHGITVKGHPLAWNYDEPAWLPDDPARVAELQMARIADCVGRFAGLIEIWDVVNEAAAFDRPNLRGKKLTAAMRSLGRARFVRQAFLSARRANPAAMLLINDYRVGADYEKVISELVDEAGRALYDAIGIQSHMHAGTWSMSKVWAVCERFGRFGVPLHFTEMTVLSGPLKTDDDWSSYRSDWQTTSAGEQAQADYVEKVYRLLFSHPAVQAITWWDLSDARAWQGAPAGLLRKDLSPKPAYRRLLKLIKDEWWTDAHASTGPGGRARLRIFRGQHRLTVRAPDGRRATVELTTTSDQPNRLTVRLQGTK